jgi:tetratricopeptide (TPR) repeat protein
MVAQLLDRLAAADDSAFVASWIDSVLGTRSRLEPTLAVRLLRAYREIGRVDRAREIAASLPSSPSTWNVLDTARLAIERSLLWTFDGRAEHAEAELRQASRALASAPRGTGLREQLDLHLASAQLELKMHRVPQAQAALRLAEHVSERLEDGAWRIPVSMLLGHLAMRLADPKTAAKHYAAAHARAPQRGLAAMRAQGNLAIALGSTGKFDDARTHAQAASSIAGEIAAGWRHADAYDVLAIVEIAADRPAAALAALDDAVAALGEFEQPTLRYQLAGHRTWVLALLGRVPAAKQWLAKADRFRAELGTADAIDDQDLIATRSRVFEAAGQYREAIDTAAPYADKLPDAFVTGSLNLVIARSALALGEMDTARVATERAALSGDKHGWIFPERSASSALWELALRSGDSRVVRYAERMIAYVTTGTPPPSLPPPPKMPLATIPPLAYHLPVEVDSDPVIESFGDGDALIYVTTPAGVSRVKLSEVKLATIDAALVVDTITHALRVNEREISLERRRALEPLVVQLLRRAREGLSAEEILRDAGEHGKTRYRLSPAVRFALIEPLSAST